MFFMSDNISVLRTQMIEASHGGMDALKQVFRGDDEERKERVGGGSTRDE